MLKIRFLFFSIFSSCLLATTTFALDSLNHVLVPSYFLEDTSRMLEEKSFEGEISGTLFDSVLSVVGDEVLASEMEKAFEADFTSNKGLRVGARFLFDVEVLYNESNEFIKYGKITYAKLIVGRAIVEKVANEEDENFTSLKTLLPEEAERIFENPVETQSISSAFNLARRHPVKKRLQPHNGIDFRAKSGDPVYAALEGRIITKARTRAKGKFILIEHDNGFQSTYDHLKNFSKSLRVGDYVSTGEQIGEVGRTGYATGAHLHFGIMKNGEYVNPLNYLKDYYLENEVDEDINSLEQISE